MDQYHGDKYPTHLHHHSGLWDWSFDSLVPSYSTSEVAPCHGLVCLFTFPKMSRFPSPNQYSLRQKNRVHRIKEGSGLSSSMKSFSPKGLLLGPIHCRIRSSFWDRFQTPSTIKVFTSSPDNLTGALNPPPHRRGADWWVLHKETSGDHTFHPSKPLESSLFGFSCPDKGCPGGCLWLLQENLGEKKQAPQG